MRALSAVPGASAPRLVYGPDELEDACAFAVRAGGQLRPRALTAAVRAPREALAFAQLCTLPIVELRASASALDRWRAARCPGDDVALFEGCWAQAAIATVGDERAYLRGRSRQAVRTNIRRAREQGVRAEGLADYERYVQAAATVYASRPGGRAALADLRLHEAPEGFAWYAATADDGRAVAIAAAALFDEFAVLAVLVGDVGFRWRGHTQYLLHTHVLVDLAARGVRTLVAGSVLREGAGLRYLQARLGYRVCHVAPTVLGGGLEPRETPRLSRRFMRGPTVGSAWELYQAWLEPQWGQATVVDTAASKT